MKEFLIGTAVFVGAFSVATQIGTSLGYAIARDNGEEEQDEKKKKED